jgi:excisionase family DNA binding protein
VTPEKAGRPPKSDYVTLREAAELLEVSARTIQRMMDRGQLAFRRTPGGTRRVRRSSLEEYVATTVDNGDNRV